MVESIHKIDPALRYVQRPGNKAREDEKKRNPPEPKDKKQDEKPDDGESHLIDIVG